LNPGEINLCVVRALTNAAIGRFETGTGPDSFVKTLVKPFAYPQFASSATESEAYRPLICHLDTMDY